MDYLEKTCEEIDASVFSSDMLFIDEQREMLKNLYGPMGQSHQRT